MTFSIIKAISKLILYFALCWRCWPRYSCIFPLLSNSWLLTIQIFHFRIQTAHNSHNIFIKTFFVMQPSGIKNRKIPKLKYTYWLSYWNLWNNPSSFQWILKLVKIIFIPTIYYSILINRQFRKKVWTIVNYAKGSFSLNHLLSVYPCHK